MGRKTRQDFSTYLPVVMGEVEWPRASWRPSPSAQPPSALTRRAEGGSSVRTSSLLLTSDWP